MRISIKNFWLCSALMVAPLYAGATTYLGSEATTKVAPDNFDLDGVFIDPEGTGEFSYSMQQCEWYMSSCDVYGSRQISAPSGGMWGAGYGLSDGYDTSEDYGGEDTSKPDPSCDQMDFTAEQIAAYIQKQITLPYGPVDPGSFDMSKPGRRFAEFVSFLDQTQKTDITSYVVPRGNSVQSALGTHCFFHARVHPQSS